MIVGNLVAFKVHIDCFLSSLFQLDSQGIGGATALLFAKEGASVVVSDLDDGNALFHLLGWSQ